MGLQQQHMDVDVTESLKQIRGKAPAALHDYFVQFEDLYDRKLWHQLTVLLKQFAHLSAAQPLLLALYDNFIVHWETRINPSEFVQLMLLTARQYADTASAIAFLDKIAAKVQSGSKEVHVLARMETAHYKLIAADMAGTRAIIDECEAVLDTLTGIDPVVHAAFYRVSADYNKARAHYAPFYKNALLFLACVNVEDLPVVERTERAYDLCIAALLGDTIYNFGELLMHPILASLKGTPHEWLGNLVVAFNAGDIAKFDVLASQFSKLPLLQVNVNFLRQKLCLMALVELVFKRPGDYRRIALSVVGQETRLPANEVEHLIMKALSLGLIRGTIDQVEQVVQVDWVQPRVLDKQQIDGMRERLAAWKTKVVHIAQVMESEAPELFAQ